MQIPSMALPNPNNETDLDSFRAYESVQLFLERVRNVQPNFELTAEIAPNVAEIVRRLDGIPLALELAAARLRMMSVAQIAKTGHAAVFPRARKRTGSGSCACFVGSPACIQFA